MSTEKANKTDSTTSPAKTGDEQKVVVRPALELLNRLRRGQIMDLLAIEINRVVKGVKDCESGKGGTVKLTLSIDRVKKMVDVVAIRADIVGKAPEDPPASDLMFYDDDGNLHTRNPNQGDLYDDPLRSA